jgi:hypothetical protein
VKAVSLLFENPENMTDLRYPVGTFNPPTVVTETYLQNCIEAIRSTPERMAAALEGLTDEQLDTPYRPGGWTLRQLAHHLPDSHMHCYLRFHWALTEDSPLIKPYDEKTWATLPYHQSVPIELSLNLLKAIHDRWMIMLDNLTAEELECSYRHPEDGQVYTIQKAILLYAWHGDHHIAHITGLRERMGW